MARFPPRFAAARPGSPKGTLTRGTAAYLRGEDTSRFATIAKLTAGRLVRRVIDTCIQFHGGVGYMEETWTAGFFRDARLLSIGGGADEVILRVPSRMDGFGGT